MLFRSPLMTGTIRLSKGVRREAGSEESRRRNPGSDVQEAVGQSDGCGGYKANTALGNPARDGNARLSFGSRMGRSDESGRRRHVLPREVSALVRSHRTTEAAMQRDRSREVSRGRSSSTERRAESLMQGAEGGLRWTWSSRKAISTTATAGRAELVPPSMDRGKRIRHSFRNEP